MPCELCKTSFVHFPTILYIQTDFCVHVCLFLPGDTFGCDIRKQHGIALQSFISLALIAYILSQIYLLPLLQSRLHHLCLLLYQMTANDRLRSFLSVRNVTVISVLKLTSRNQKIIACCKGTLL